MRVRRVDKGDSRVILHTYPLEQERDRLLKDRKTGEWQTATEMNTLWFCLFNRIQVGP